MTPAAALSRLPPQQRAAVIYEEARASMSARLWQAALGDGGDRDASSFGQALAMPAPARSSALEQLLLQLSETARGPDILSPPQHQTIPATTPPTAAPAANTPVREPAMPRTDALGHLGVNARFGTILAESAQRTGIPASALSSIVNAEAAKGADGSWQLFSRNPRSSAAGLGQFLSRTWEGLAEMPGTWLNGHARANGWLGGDGQVTATSRATLLSLRYDPTAAINGIADYARRNLDGLARAGITPRADANATARMAYLGHHLGLGDAIRFLHANGLGEQRARTVLAAQVGTQASEARIAAAGSATGAHRAWLLGYLDRKFAPANPRSGDFPI